MDEMYGSYSIIPSSLIVAILGGTLVKPKQFYVFIEELSQFNLTSLLYVFISYKYSILVV